MIAGRFAPLAVWLAAVVAVHGYDFIGRSPVRWADGEIPMNLQLDLTLSSHLLRDGKSSWNEVALEALGLWNGHLTPVQFTAYTNGIRRDGNDQNEVFFSSEVYGHRFGGSVLAITTAWRIGARRIEGDTIFNTAIDWDSYRGALEFDTLDLRRVAIHEFGHTLGLDHPDQAKQIVAAVMNSIVSDLDALATDDVHGARALYPPDARYSISLEVVPPASGTVTATPAPDLDGKYPAGAIVKLRAKPNRRQRFNFWGGDQNAAGRTLKVRVVDDETFVANFSTNGAPVVVAQPRSQISNFSNPVTFRVRASSTTPVTYQWEFNGVAIPAAAGSELLLNFVSHEDSGLYSCRITNARGETWSRPARLVVDGY
ncbi:MAG TPA: matrixin family metalloprotease [Methylomirabilota bacterium]|nr:matrixin family metalloprotease [Methylomirabilota bacterium]